MKIKIISLYYPKYEIKSQTIKPKIDSSNSLPPNIQNFRDKFLSGSGFIIYEENSDVFYTVLCLVFECWNFSNNRKL